MEQVIDFFLISTLTTLLIMTVTIFMIRRGWLPPFFEQNMDINEPQMMGSSTEREVAVQKYFTKTPEALNDMFAKVMIGLGGLLLFFGVIGAISQELRTFGLAALIVGGGLALFSLLAYLGGKWAYEQAILTAEPKPTDAQLDAWLNGDLEKIKGEALEKLDLKPHEIVGSPIDPIMVVGPASQAKLAVGKDGIIRFSVYEVLVIYLTDYQLAVYQCVVDLVNGIKLSQATQEYHYTDVVSVTTQTDNSGLFTVMLNGERKPIASYQKFGLSVASGEKIEVAISFPQLEKIVKRGQLAPTGANKAQKIIRAKLREKKGAILAASTHNLTM